MDPRNTGQNPFARPLSQPNTRDPRQAPIPPPPYTLQAPLNRSQLPFGSDPFIPRRNERDDPRQEPPKASTHGPFSISSYAVSLPREVLGTATSVADRQRDNMGSWTRNGEGNGDRFRPQQMEGELAPCEDIPATIPRPGEKLGHQTESTPSLSLSLLVDRVTILDLCGFRFAF